MYVAKVMLQGNIRKKLHAIFLKIILYIGIEGKARQVNENMEGKLCKFMKVRCRCRLEED